MLNKSAVQFYEIAASVQYVTCGKCYM